MSLDAIFKDVKECEEALPKTRPNLGVLSEYVAKRKVKEMNKKLVVS